jgi:hypothetical protein
MAEGSAITVKIGAETDGIEQGLRKIQGSLKNLESNTKNSAAGVGQSFASMAGAVAVGQAAFEGFKAAASFGLSAVTNSISGLVGSFGSAISAAAQMETLETAFIPLLGSADAAQKRIADLSKFAAETPFELPEVAKASRTLETLTQGALATSEGLRLVGDVASGTNTPFEEMSTTIGRLYDGLQSGRPVGDVMQRLQELGAISGDTRSEIEALSASGKNVEAWAIAEEALGRFSGSMKLQSSTWGGLLSTFSDNVTQALAKFGEPIIDSLKPYLSATIVLVEGLAGKAAELGKQFSEKFIASSSAAKSFQTAIDAINIGETSKGFQLFWETTKLQAMQTGNEIYKSLVGAFQTAGDFLGKIFSPSGALISTAISAFELLGTKITQSIANNLAKAFAGNILTQGLSDSLFNVANDSYEAGIKIEQNLKDASGRIATQFTEAGAALPKSFEENYAKVPPLFADLEGLQTKISTLEAEIATRVAATNDQRAATTAQTEAELAKRQELRAATEAAAATEQANAVALVELETAINAAKAEGNEQLVKTLESEKQQLEGQQEIAKLTEEYKTKLGVNADEAARLANNFVNAKNAAAGIGDRSAIVTITTTVDDTRWKDLLAELSANSNPKAIAVALEVTGKDNVQDAFATLQNMETINKNHQVAMDVLGAKSLEEVKMNLDAVATPAQAQLAMQITGEDDLKSAIGNLDSFKGTKTAKALLEKQGFENIDQLKDALKGIIGEKRTKMIVESLGVKDAEAAKEALNAILNANGKKATITADADTTTAEKKIADLSTKTATVPLDGDTNPLKETLSAFSAGAIKLTLDAADSISAIRTALAEPIKMTLDGSGSGNSEGGTSGLTGLVSDIKGLLTELNRKLPTPALV